MKTYLRIIDYARPLGRLLPQYIVYTLLAVVLGTIQFTLLIPLFRVLFGSDEVDEELIAKYREEPAFEFSLGYINHYFNHFFLEYIDQYGQMGALAYVCVIIVIAVFFANLFMYLSNVTMAKIRANVITNLRMDIFQKVSLLHLGFFTDERKGDIMSRVTNDIQEVEKSVVDSLKVVLREPFQIIVYFIVLFVISYKLTIFTLLFLPISGGIISEVTRRLKKKARQSQESLGRIVGMIDETISGMRVVKAFNARDLIVERFRKEVRRYARLNVSMARKNESASPLSQFLGVLVVAGILLYGGSLIFSNQSTLEPEAFVTYIIIFSQVLNPAKAISKALSNIQRGLASGERIFHTIDTQPKVRDKKDAIELKSFEKEIAFENMGFAYGDEKVLKNIHLVIPKGKMVALVGPSGGGKSTLADLLPRFYDPTEGRVLIDGHDLRDISTYSLRQQMGIVTQESILFNDTIHNNIAFGTPNATRDQVVRAAMIANAHAFIENTEEGYDTIIGERGGKLSGGQRQRLSIARAVLKNPPILILDEATSALDTESEKLVQDALDRLMENRTSLVIAHRLSTVQHADLIVVIEKGKIVEQGTHRELLEREGLYRKLTNLQQVKNARA